MFKGVQSKASLEQGRPGLPLRLPGAPLLPPLQLPKHWFQGSPHLTQVAFVSWG